MTLRELEELIIEVSGKPLSSMIQNQISKYYQEGYTYKEIGRCIWYFYRINNNDIRKIDQYGIGIVPCVREQANAYYDNLKSKQEQQRIAAERVKEQSIKEIEIKATRRNFNKKEVDISGIR